MTKSNKLRTKLKAADRRRRRRTESTAAISPQAPAKSNAPDVTGLVVESILNSSQPDRAAEDSAVIAALRSCLKGSVPTRPPADSIYRQLQRIANRQDVAQPEFLAAAKQLLELASSHKSEKRVSGEPNPFLAYLLMLAS